MKSIFCVSILSLVVVLGAIGCSSKSDDKSQSPAAPQDDQIIVAKGAGKQCALSAGTYTCKLQMITKQTGKTQELEMDVRKKDGPSGRQVLEVEGFSYTADGDIHQHTTEDGDQIQYSVSCENGLVLVNAKATTFPWSMRVKLNRIDDKNLKSEVLLNKKDVSGKGSGLCQLN